MSNNYDISKELLGCTIAEVEARLAPMTDEERENVVKAMWTEYHNS